MWFSVVYSLIDNDTRHRSGQNLLRTHSAAPRESITFWPLRWRVSLSIRLYTTLNHIRFVIFVLNWKQRLGFESARAALCKWAACTRQTISKPFANSLKVILLKLFYYQTFFETWGNEHSWYEHYKNAIKIWGHRACLSVSRLLKWGIFTGCEFKVWITFMQN